MSENKKKLVDKQQELNSSVTSCDKTRRGRCMMLTLLEKVDLACLEVRFGLNVSLRGRLQGALSMCVFMSDKPFVVEACPLMSHASASNGLSDIETLIENAPCNRPLNELSWF
jgi:hypothetical protein